MYVFSRTYIPYAFQADEYYPLKQQNVLRILDNSSRTYFADSHNDKDNYYMELILHCYKMKGNQVQNTSLHLKIF